MASSPDEAGILPLPSVVAAVDGGPDGAVVNQAPPEYVRETMKDLSAPLRTHTIAVTPTAPESAGLDDSADTGAARFAAVPYPDPASLTATFESVVSNVRRVYIGGERIIRLALCCLMAEGHLLVEDHPGVGKTTLAKALARSLDLGFGRVQFTADLLPADVTGAMVLDRESGRITFRPGPVFTNILLADELNRASPKAQSALLEAMEERQVSADGTSHALPQPFMVIATQNPYDAAGTFPLPHSQRDRFLLRLSLGYPDRQAEDELLASTTTRPVPEDLAGVGGPVFLAAFADAARRVHVTAEVRGYVLDLVGETRTHPDLTVGASPRAALSVLRAASAVAVAVGRDYVTPDDIKLVAEPALAHRVVVHPAAELAGITSSATIDEILSRLVVPVGGPRELRSSRRTNPVVAHGPRRSEPVLTTRGRVLVGGALGAALSGLLYGVEEFVFLALVVGALLCLGGATVSYRGRACRRSVRLVTAVPQAEIGAGQVADAELTVINTGRRHLPSMLVVVADANWTLSFPGLAQGALAARRRAAEAAERPRPARGFAEPSDRRTRRQRAADRRAVNAAHALTALAPGAQAVSRFAVPSGRRGVLTLSGVTVWCQDPFGLAARRVAVAPPAHVIVYPAAAETAADEPRRGARPGRHPESGATLPTNALSGDELSGLRPYAPGDRLTRLHWPSLARSGDLLVREFVEPDSGSLSLLVDLRPSAHTEETFERTIARVAGMGTRALAQGVTVELCTSAGDRLTIPVGTAGRQTLLRALALLGPTVAPSAAARRWGGSSGTGAVWAAPGAVSGASGPALSDTGGDVVLVTTAAGAEQDVLPVSLRPRADTVVIR